MSLLSTVSITPQVARKFSRAKAQLKRDDTVRALEAILEGLEEFNSKGMPGKARFEVEVLIIECVQELNRQPAVRSLFENLAKAKNASIPYVPGQEQKLKVVLALVHKALAESLAAGARIEADKKLQRKIMLEQNGLGYLRGGDQTRGKSNLKVLAEEYGHEPGLLTQVGEWFMDFNLYYEAAEMLELAIEAFPKDKKAYGLATRCYTELREHAKSEAIYLRAIRQFGKHPRTLLNLAKLYSAWNKKEDAFSTAQEAYNKDNSLTEAKEILDKYS